MKGQCFLEIWKFGDNGEFVALIVNHETHEFYVTIHLIADWIPGLTICPVPSSDLCDWICSSVILENFEDNQFLENRYTSSFIVYIERPEIFSM